MQLVDGIKLQPCRDTKAVPQRRGQQTQARGGADQRKGLQFNPHRARRRPRTNHQIKFKILKRGIKHLFHHRVEAVNFIDEQHITRLEIGQDRRQIARLGQHRPRCHAKTHTQFAADDLGQCGFTQARRAIKQCMIHGLTALTCGLNEHFKIGPRLGLANKLIQTLRTQGAIIVFGHRVRAQGGIRFSHGLAFRRQKFQCGADQHRGFGLGRGARGFGNGTRRLAGGIAQIGQRRQRITLGGNPAGRS